MEREVAYIFSYTRMYIIHTSFSRHFLQLKKMNHYSLWGWGPRGGGEIGPMYICKVHLVQYGLYCSNKLKPEYFKRLLVIEKKARSGVLF